MLPHEDGYWTATVTSRTGVAVTVDNEHGSWAATLRQPLGRREVLPHVAAALQERARRAARELEKMAA